MQYVNIQVLIQEEVGLLSQGLDSGFNCIQDIFSKSIKYIQNIVIHIVLILFVVTRNNQDQLSGATKGARSTYLVLTPKILV